MKNETWHYIENQFLNATENSYKKCNILCVDHQSKLTAEAADPVIAALVARTLPLSNGFTTTYIAWISAKATYKGYTQMSDTLLRELSAQKIKEWDIQIQNVHLEGTGDYTILLPEQRGPFQQGGKDARIVQLEGLSGRLANYPALAATKTDVDLFLGNLKAIRDVQQQKEELVSMASDQMELARVQLCEMMFGNLGALMDRYRKMPTVVANFWQLALLRTSGKDSDESELPASEVNISGKVTAKPLGKAVLGGSVKLQQLPVSQTSLEIEVFTDKDGNFTLTIEDLTEPMSVVITFSATDLVTQQLNLDIEPGTDYPATNVELKEAPMV
jgi:hypothetical protein